VRGEGEEERKNRGRSEESGDYLLRQHKGEEVGEDIKKKNDDRKKRHVSGLSWGEKK